MMFTISLFSGGSACTTLSTQQQKYTFVVKTAKDKKKTLKIFDKFFSILSNKVSLFIF